MCSAYHCQNTNFLRHEVLEFENLFVDKVHAEEELPNLEWYLLHLKAYEQALQSNRFREMSAFDNFFTLPVRAASAKYLQALASSFHFPWSTRCACPESSFKQATDSTISALLTAGCISLSSRNATPVLWFFFIYFQVSFQAFVSNCQWWHS